MYLATLLPYGDNNKTYVCRPMTKSSMKKLNIKYVFDEKINQIK